MSDQLFFFMTILYEWTGAADEDRCFSLHPVGNCIQVSEHRFISHMKVIANAKITLTLWIVTQTFLLKTKTNNKNHLITVGLGICQLSSQMKSSIKLFTVPLFSLQKRKQKKDNIMRAILSTTLLLPWDLRGNLQPVITSLWLTDHRQVCGPRHKQSLREFVGLKYSVVC